MSKRPGDPGYPKQWCVHFRSMAHHETCEAGVAYEQFKRVNFPRCPCFLTDEGKSKTDALPCEHLRCPTPEEMAAHEGWIQKRMDQMRVVATHIRPWREAHRGKSAAETIECPVCKGSLQLSIAAYNGHVHGRCSTPDCVSWME